MSHTFVVLWCLQVCLLLSINLIKWWIGTKGKKIIESEAIMITAYFPGWGMGRLVPLQITLSLFTKLKTKQWFQRTESRFSVFTHQHVRQPHSMLLFLEDLNPLKWGKERNISVFLILLPSAPPFLLTLPPEVFMVFSFSGSYLVDK